MSPLYLFDHGTRITKRTFGPFTLSNFLQGGYVDAIFPNRAYFLRAKIYQYVKLRQSLTRTWELA